MGKSQVLTPFDPSRMPLIRLIMDLSVFLGRMPLIRLAEGFNPVLFSGISSKMQKPDDTVWKKRYILLLAVLLLLIISGLGTARWWIKGAFPQTNGTLRLEGLDGEVEIRRDEGGVPHIYATTLHDLYFAQGVVHAQDRLWQMDFQRRVGLGRLSEWFGQPTIEVDRFLRTIGTHLAAERDWEALSHEARTVLEAYTQGVNAYMATVLALTGRNGPTFQSFESFSEGAFSTELPASRFRKGRLPLEYQFLQVEWEPWQPVHSLAWLKMMQWNLNGNWEEELFRAQLMKRVGAARTAFLLGDNTVVATNETYDLGAPDLNALAAILEPVGVDLSNSTGSRASNAWVVAGTRTATGRPMLANDLHLGISMPSLWYEVGLHAPGVDVIGASLPGTPAVVIGHNAHIAWGMTNLASDTQDLFIERLNEAGDAYEWQGQMEPLTTRREVIHVKDGQQVLIDVKETHHGPLLNDVVAGLEVPIALQWRATTEPSHLVEAILALNFAQNREQVITALHLWDSPAQNVLYADREGNIAYMTTGDLPIRPAAGGLLPQPGWSGEWEWQGMVPFDELPQQWNPPQQYVIRANQYPFPDDFPYYAGTERAEPSRFNRINSILVENKAITLDDYEAIQRDVTSLPAQQLLPLLLKLPSDDIIIKRAQEQLDGWNNQMLAELPGAGIYAVTRVFVLRELLTDEMGDDEIGRDLLEMYLSDYDNHTRLLSQLLEEPTHALWDDIRTAQQEKRDEILLRALEKMSDWLGRRFGDVPHEWFWKRLHRATFDHPLGAIKPLDRIFNRTVESNGDGSTVNATPFSYASDYNAMYIPSYRQIIDVGAWQHSRMLHTTGQSGQPFHPHYDDMIDPWQRVELWPMWWSDEQTKAASEGRVLKLVP